MSQSTIFQPEKILVCTNSINALKRPCELQIYLINHMNHVLRIKCRTSYSYDKHNAKISYSMYSMFIRELKENTRLDSVKGPCIMPCSEKGISVLATILIIDHRT